MKYIIIILISMLPLLCAGSSRTPQKISSLWLEPAKTSMLYHKAIQAMEGLKYSLQERKEGKLISSYREVVKVYLQVKETIKNPSVEQLRLNNYLIYADRVLFYANNIMYMIPILESVYAVLSMDGQIPSSSFFKKESKIYI